MYELPSTPRRHASLQLGFLALGAGLLMSACGGGSGSTGGQSGIVGDLQAKPGGGTFFVDPNGSGSSARFRLTDLFWGRLVDVYGTDGMGTADPTPTYEDFLIEPGILTDGFNYRLETSAVSQQTNLIVEAVAGTPAFETLVRETFDNLPTINPQNTNGTTGGPFTQVPRNATVSLRFDDCLDDDATQASLLPSNVRVFTGYAPSTPFDARIIFDPNFGALVGTTFHSTRILVDMTVTTAEAMTLPTPPPINGLGLPTSITTSSLPNVAIEIPTEAALIAGQFQVLTNLRGSELTFSENGPGDSLSPTFDVVRGFRSGNELDPNNGFLLDPLPPEILGSWPISVSGAVDVGATPGFDFSVTLNFPTVCQAMPEVGDVLNVNGFFLEVTADGAAPDMAGDVPGLMVTSASAVPMPSSIQGTGLFLSPFDPMLAVNGACWVNFVPPPAAFPDGGISPTAQASVRFSEPMDPDSIAALDDFLLVRGTAPVGGLDPAPAEIVVGTVVPANDLLSYTFAPFLPLTHTNTVADPFYVRLSGPLDLAGNAVVNSLPDVDFTLDPVALDVENGSFALRFAATDELGITDVTGQAFYDLSRGVLLPRTVTFSSWPADRTLPPAMAQIPTIIGVTDPLTPLGSRLQTVWRYVDLGWEVNDATKFNMDVIGVNWAPFGGQVIADFYEEFEVLLSHSAFLPDETFGMTTISFPNSGLNGGPELFSSNVLVDPESPQTLVHNRAQGYTVNPSDLFLSSSGTLMMPFPVNRTQGLSPLTFTWRDTAALAVAGPGNGGIPMSLEVGLNILPPDPDNPGMNLGGGALAAAGMIPTIGLPLLMEFKVFPSNTGVGLNGFDINFASGVGGPNFTVWSSGGVDAAGMQVVRNPDLETVPRGGFNGASTPPGQPSSISGLDAFYLGQLDVVTRVSRAFTAFFDTGNSTGVDFRPTIVLPAADDQPSGTQVRLDYRGATSMTPDAVFLDASDFDFYGNLRTGTATFVDGQGLWSEDINFADTAQYLQVRITFLNNIESGLNPELQALGILYEE